MAQAKLNARKRWYVAGTGAIGVALVVLFVLSRRDIGTRQVRYNGELCTEYFDTKDGSEVRAVCPSRGGEWYVDTGRTIHYAPNFPVEHATEPSNDR